MGLARLRTQAETIADLWPQGRIDPRDRRHAGEIEMDQRIRAERLDELDVDGDAVGGIGSNGKMFRANTDDSAAGLPQAARGLTIQRQRCSSLRKDRTLLEPFYGEEIHGGRADEA